MGIPQEWISDIVLGFTQILDGKHVITLKTVDCKALLAWIMLHFRTDSRYTLHNWSFLWSSPIYSISPNWSLSIKEVSESIGPLFLSSSAIRVCFYETILFPRQNLAIYLSFYLRNRVAQMKIRLKILICEVKNLNIGALLGYFFG